MQENKTKQNNATASDKFIEYIDTVNYQLREPVTNIFASLPMLAENINSSNTEKAMENLQAIYKRTYSITKSVNNMTTVSKLQSGYEYAKETVDFSRLVKNAFNGSQMILPDYVQIDCTADEGCIIEGNHGLLATGLFNILLNSLEYRAENDVKISVSLKNGGSRCVFTYRDNSVGIKDENIENVFSPYFSADPYNDGEISNKLGLGLYIAKQAVNHAGGTILIQSDFSKGVNIVISIPLCSEDSHTALKSRQSDFMLNKYSEMFVQLCEFCDLPDLV